METLDVLDSIKRCRSNPKHYPVSVYEFTIPPMDTCADCGMTAKYAVTEKDGTSWLYCGEC